MLQLDKPSFRLFAVVLFISGGVAVLTYGEDMTTTGDNGAVLVVDADSDGLDDAAAEAKTFSWIGTGYVLLSCFCAGIKWGLSELTLAGARRHRPPSSSASRRQATTKCSCCFRCCGYAKLAPVASSAHPSPQPIKVLTVVAIASDDDDDDDDDDADVSIGPAVVSTKEKEQPSCRAAGASARTTAIWHGGGDDAQEQAPSSPPPKPSPPPPSEPSKRTSSFSLLSTTAFVSALTLLPVDFASDEYAGTYVRPSVRTPVQGSCSAHSAPRSLVRTSPSCSVKPHARAR